MAKVESDETIEINGFGSNILNQTVESGDKKIADKYTVVDMDNLDEDDPILGQEYALFSFLSPEGVMNCNVRAVKFRGAFPTLELAEKHCRKLEKKDKYFKIFVGQTGKWLDFDPPADHVEKELVSDPNHQKIIDAQHEQRMKKINELAGKYKQSVDKKENGKDQRIAENKKVSAADDLVDKHKSAQKSSESVKDRMRKKLAMKKANEDNKKLAIVLDNPSTLDPVQKNIDAIRRLNQESS